MPSVFSHEMQLLLRLVLAALFGAVLGYERERSGRSAGLRTNLLVSAGSALMTIISLDLFPAFSGSASSALRMDPARIAAQIVVGIGFIGAGVIIKERGGIRGLTTAATLWLVAGIGMACGAGMFFIATATTLIALTALTLLKNFERKMSRDSYRIIEVTCCEKEADALPVMREFLEKRQIEVHSVNYCHNVKNFMTTYEFFVGCKDCETSFVDITKEFSRFEFVGQVRLKSCW
jgi:putative Mg2+ transporter-C (MgtC) family protein